MCSPKKGCCNDQCFLSEEDILLGAGVLGDSFGALGHGVLGQFTGQQQADSSLDFSAGDGGSPVVVGQAAGFGGNPLKDVVHEGVHDGHGFARDTSVRVDLLQHLVDVDGIALLPPPLSLLVSGTCGLGLGGGLLGSLCAWLGRHDGDLHCASDKPRITPPTPAFYLYQNVCKFRIEAADASQSEAR